MPLRYVSLVVVAVIMVVSLLVVDASGNLPALAKCTNPGPPRSDDYPTYYHDGIYNQVSGVVGGVYARIYNTTTWVEPATSNDFSAAWVGIARYPSSYLWAQTGWTEERYGERHDYVEYFLNDGVTYHRYSEYSPQPIGDWSYYAVLYDQTNGRLTFQIDGQTKKQGSIGWVPNRWDVSGEINSRANQMPGGYAVSEDFTDINFWHNAGPWRHPPSPWVVRNTNPNYFAHWSYLGNLVIWDWACYD